MSHLFSVPPHVRSVGHTGGTNDLTAIASSDRSPLTVCLNGVINRIGGEIQLARSSNCAELAVELVDYGAIPQGGKNPRLGRSEEITEVDYAFQTVHELDGEPEFR